MDRQREEVIRGLESFRADLKPFAGCAADWKKVDDALALLKAQEPVYVEERLVLDELCNIQDYARVNQIDWMADGAAFTATIMNMLRREISQLQNAQKPRVMTLEEALGSDECWLERRDGGITVAHIALNGQDSGDYDVDSNELSTMRSYIFHSGYYGKYWRCWTSRPTDAQREAEPWK